jgi:hypothetical protein
MADTRQQGDWKRWFTFGRTIAIAAVGAVALVAALFSNIKIIGITLDDWFSPRLQGINIRDLTVGETYPADLYDLDHQDRQSVWARTIPPAETGYVAQLEFVVDNQSGAAARNCMVETRPAKLMWPWLDPAPPQYDQRPGSEFWRPGHWIGVDRYELGRLRGGEGDKSVEFEVFFREKKLPLKVRLVCDGRKTPWLQEELNESVKTVPRVFRVMGHFNPMDPSIKY